MKKIKEGFTLIELLIVIVIIGILAVIVVGLVANNANNRAQDAALKSDMREIQTGLETYYVDNEAYPGAIAAIDGTYVQAGHVAGMSTAPVYDPIGGGAGCYSVAVDLSDGTAFTLTCKQE